MMYIPVILRYQLSTSITTATLKQLVVWRRCESGTPYYRYSRRRCSPLHCLLAETKQRQLANPTRCLSAGVMNSISSIAKKIKGLVESFLITRMVKGSYRGPRERRSCCYSLYWRTEPAAGVPFPRGCGNAFFTLIHTDCGAAAGSVSMAILNKLPAICRTVR